MEEDKLLKTFAKLLGAGAEDVIKEIESKKEKERRLLESFSRSLSVASDLDITIEEEKIPVEINLPTVIAAQPEIVATKTISQEQFDEVLAIASSEPIEEVALEESGRQEEPQLPVNDIINQTVAALSSVPQKDIQQAADSIPDSLRKEIDIIKKSVADFHRFALRHSQMGGGGEVWLHKLNDVDYFSLKSATDGQVLTYNATTKKWYSSYSSGGGGIDGLSTNHSNTLTLSTGYDFIPSTDVAQNLGSPTHRFKDLYLSGHSIVLGNTTLSSDPGTNSLTVTPAGGQSFIVSSPSNVAVGYSYGISNTTTVVETNIKSINFDTSTGLVVTDQGSGNVFISISGAQGGTGYQGSQGVVGFQGSVGTQGSTGYQGSAGFQGSVGFQGSFGDTGYQGSVGFQGSLGGTGYQGSVGFQGSAGLTGPIAGANTQILFNDSSYANGSYNLTYSNNTLTVNGNIVVSNTISINTLVANGSSGSTGQKLVSDGTSVRWHSSYTTGATPPSDPILGDIWFYTATNKPYMWTFDGVSNFWYDFLPFSG